MYRLTAVLLLSSFAFAQAAKPTPPAATAPKTQTAPAAKAPATPEQKKEAPQEKKEAEVLPTAAVITIEGICQKPATTSAACKTVITREQFEKLVDALNPKMPQPTRRQLASVYARLLVMSEEAEKRGLQNTPATQQILRFARLQALSQVLLRDLQEQAAKVPPAEEEKYYQEHPAMFTEASLQRIFLPKNPPEIGASQPDEKAKAEKEKALKAEADKIRAAAAAGGDFEKLQKQAYEDLGLKSTPPPTNTGTLRAVNLPGGQAKVLDLQAGQISEPLDEPGGFYIYKLVSKKTLTLAEARSEIDRVLENERMQREMEGLTGNVKPVFNESYFGPMPAEASPGQIGPAMPSTRRPPPPKLPPPPSK